MTLDVDVVDSADGHNPVIKIEQETEHGTETLQLTKYQAAKLTNKLCETVDNLAGNR